MKATLPSLTFWLITGLTVAPALGGPALTQVTVERDGDFYQASCRLEGALTPEVEEEIASGLATTIEYHLNVYRRRTAFFDQVLVKHRVECTVRYDTLTQQYTLTRRVDEDLQETQVTGDPVVMREFMTSLKNVPLLRSELLRPGEDYYLKAKSSLGLIWRFYMIPWSMDTEWTRVPIGPPGGGKDVATRP